ncbi:MAG: N-acetyltransferase [Anaerolineales bacterium]
MPIQIRKERPGDEKSVFEVNSCAFGRDAEPKVVDQLRINCPEGISLVAEVDRKIVGHILFTPAWIETEQKTVHGMGLAPLAVAPECQRMGVGTALIQAGIEELRAADTPFIVVLGHPGYYPKFGFEKGSKYGFRSAYDEVPDEAFMLLVFQPEAIQGIRGTIKIRPEFTAAM